MQHLAKLRGLLGVMRLLKVLFVALMALFTIVGGALLAATVAITGLLIASGRLLVTAVTPQKRKPRQQPRTSWSNSTRSSNEDVIEVSATEVKS